MSSYDRKPEWMSIPCGRESDGVEELQLGVVFMQNGSAVGAMAIHAKPTKTGHGLETTAGD